MAPRNRRTASATDAGENGDDRESPSPTRRPRQPAYKAVHLPPFLAKDVRFWFLQVEALFRTARITDDQTKFDHVITAMDVAAAADIRDVLENPPAENRYDVLKAALIDRLAISEAARIKRILSNETMGDRTPSQHLRHLRAQAGNNFSDQVLMSIWMSSLPLEIKPIIASNTDLSLEKLAAMADSVVDVTGCRRVAAISTPDATTSSATSHATTSAVEAQIAALTKQISALTKSVSRQHARRDGKDDATAPKQRRDKSPAATPGLCWYHRTFKEAAMKCTAPCTWTGPRPDQSGNGQTQL